MIFAILHTTSFTYWCTSHVTCDALVFSLTWTLTHAMPFIAMSTFILWGSVHLFLTNHTLTENCSGEPWFLLSASQQPQETTATTSRSHILISQKDYFCGWWFKINWVCSLTQQMGTVSVILFWLVIYDRNFSSQTPRLKGLFQAAVLLHSQVMWSLLLLTCRSFSSNIRMKCHCRSYGEKETEFLTKEGCEIL